MLFFYPNGIFLTLKNITKQFILITLMSSLLFGCATYHGDGIVVKKEIYNFSHKKSLKPIKDRTADGGLVGATSGAMGGATLGLIAGGLSASGGAGVAISTLVGALGGGLIFGGIGAAVGSSVGLLQYGLTPSEKELWQYQVKSLKDSKMLSVTQQTATIPLDSKVKIMEQNGRMFIKRK